MIIVKLHFDVGLTFPGFGSVPKEVEPAKLEGWLFRVEGDRLIIHAPRGHLETPADAVREELAAAGLATPDMLMVMSEPLSRVRLTLLDDGIPDVIEGPSKALRDQRERARQAAAQANEAVAVAAPPPQPKKKPKPLQVAAGNAPPGFRGNPVPPPSPPEEDAP